MRLPSFALSTCLFGLAFATCPSDAAEEILFVRMGSTGAKLYLSKADGSGEEPFATSNSLDYNPAWSADGEWIAFTSERAGSADLYRARPDGTGLERLTDTPAYDDQAAWSPDGREVVFVTTRADGTADLWVLDIGTRKARTLTSGAGGDFRPSWSPDGQRIAFSSDRHSTFPMAANRFPHLHMLDIYTVRADGSDLRRLTQRNEFCGSPKWTPDGRQLVAYCMSAEESWTYRFPPPAVGSSKLVSIDVTSGDIEEIEAGEGVKLYPSLVPATGLSYARKDARAPGVFYANGGRGPTGVVASPSWSPDGQRIVYARHTTRGPGPDSRPWKWSTWSRDSRYELTLTRDGLSAFSPNGEYFLTDENLGTNSGMMLVHWRSGDARLLFRSQEDRAVIGPQWSAAGDAIVFGLGAFVARVGSQGPLTPADRLERGAHIGMVAADGSEFRELTSGTNNNGFPSLSPDGKRLVYRTLGAEGQGLRIKNLEDGSIVTLTTEYDTFPLWSPRSDEIMFTRKHRDDYDLFKINSDGTGLQQMTSSRGNDAHGVWSPDGQWFLFSSSRMGFKDEALYTDAPQPYTELFVMRRDGEDLRQLTDDQWEDGGPAWRPAVAQ